MKFALAEIKLALVALLRRYTIIRPSLLTRVNYSSHNAANLIS